MNDHESASMPSWAKAVGYLGAILLVGLFFGLLGWGIIRGSQMLSDAPAPASQAPRDE